MAVGTFHRSHKGVLLHINSGRECQSDVDASLSEAGTFKFTDTGVSYCRSHEREREIMTLGMSSGLHGPPSWSLTSVPLHFNRTRT